MIDRPSDGFTFDELREEYDWMSDFMGRMAERIRGNADVRSLAAYVGKLEAENVKLREQSERLRTQLADVTESVGRVEERCAKTFEVGKSWMAKAARFEAENAKLRELVRDAWGSGHPDKSCGDCEIRDECHDDVERLSRDGLLRFSRCLFELRIEDRMRELGVEVDG